MLPPHARHQLTEMHYVLHKQGWEEFEKMWEWDERKLEANMLCITPGDKDGTPTRGKTILHLVAFRNFKLSDYYANASYRAICRAGAAVGVLDVKDCKGATALHHACSNGNVRFARHLLEQGASHFPTLRRLFTKKVPVLCLPYCTQEAASRLGSPLTRRKKWLRASMFLSSIDISNYCIFPVLYCNLFSGLRIQ